MLVNSVYWKYDLCPSTIFHTSSTCIWKIWSRVSNINIYMFLKYILKSNKNFKFSALHLQYRYSSCILALGSWNFWYLIEVQTILEKCVVFFFHQKGLWLQELYLYCICNAVLKLCICTVFVKLNMLSLLCDFANFWW